MLDLSNPGDLLQEVTAAERIRDDSLRVVWQMVERYHGPAYSGQGYASSDKVALENHYYEMVSLMVPQLVFDNPRWRVSSKLPGIQRDVATAMRHYLNRWSKDSSLDALLTKVCTDFLFFDPVVLVQREELPGSSLDEFEEPIAGVRAVRISPRRFIEDYGAMERETQKFRGHVWSISRSELKKLVAKDAGWDAEMVEALVTSKNESEKDGTDKRVPYRDELYFYEIWCPGVQMDDKYGPSKGFNGTLFTLPLGVTTEAKDIEKKWVRKPRPMYGPSWGPYAIGETYYVPDKVRSLSVLPATEVQNRDLNVQSMAAARGAAAYKRLLMLYTKDPNAATQIKSAPNDSVVSFTTGKPDDVTTQEFGGVSDMQLQYVAVARARLDRNSGISDAQRGNVTGVGSATENAIASDAASARQGYLKKQLTKFTQRIGMTVAWYGYNDSNIVLPLGEEAAQEYGMENPIFVGSFENDGGRFEDMEFEIEPFSMERTSESLMQRQSGQALEFAAKVAPIMASAPWFDWKAFANAWGDANNIAGFGDYVDVEVLRQAGVEAQSRPTAEPRAVRRLGGGATSGPSGEKKRASGGGAVQATKSAGASLGNQARGY